MSESNKYAVGIILVIAGGVAGLWAGLWWAFIGGIVELITQIRAEEMSSTAVAFAITRIFCAGLIGYAAAFIFAIPGGMLIRSAQEISCKQRFDMQERPRNIRRN